MEREINIKIKNKKEDFLERRKNNKRKQNDYLNENIARKHGFADWASAPESNMHGLAMQPWMWLHVRSLPNFFFRF